MEETINNAEEMDILCGLQKKSLCKDCKGISMRSVADSNRRNWFCRPTPSHSANRPLFFNYI